MDSDLQKKAQTLRPIVNIGKSGLTPQVIEEIKKHLKKRKLIKIKFLKNYRDTQEPELDKLLLQTGAKLIENKGFVVTLYNDA